VLYDETLEKGHIPKKYEQTDQNFNSAITKVGRYLLQIPNAAVLEVCAAWTGI